MLLADIDWNQVLIKGLIGGAIGAVVGLVMYFVRKGGGGDKRDPDDDIRRRDR